MDLERGRVTREDRQEEEGRAYGKERERTQRAGWCRCRCITILHLLFTEPTHRCDIISARLVAASSCQQHCTVGGSMCCTLS
jgi:hypothetical protein